MWTSIVRFTSINWSYHYHTRFWYQIGPISNRKVSKCNYGSAPTSFWQVASHSARINICSPPWCKWPINNTSAISKALQQLKLTHGHPPYNRRAAPRHCRDIIGDDVCCRHGGWNRRQIVGWFWFHTPDVKAAHRTEQPSPSKHSGLNYLPSGLIIH